MAGDSVAKRRITKILQATNNLRHLPNIGPLDEDFKHTPSYRYLLVSDYRIYYFIEGQTIYIAAIWDCRQGAECLNRSNYYTILRSIFVLSFVFTLLIYYLKDIKFEKIQGNKFFCLRAWGLKSRSLKRKCRKGTNHSCNTLLTPYSFVNM